MPPEAANARRDGVNGGDIVTDDRPAAADATDADAAAQTSGGGSQLVHAAVHAADERAIVAFEYGARDGAVAEHASASASVAAFQAALRAGLCVLTGVAAPGVNPAPEPAPDPDSPSR